MRNWFFTLNLIVLLSFGGLVAQGQSSADVVVLFSRDGRVLAMPLNEGYVIELGATENLDRNRLPDDRYNNFTFADSSLLLPPADEFGFYQGLSTGDANTSAYTVIAPDTPTYRVFVYDDIVIEADVSPERGYLVPIGWRASGELILLERYTLYSLDDVRIWLWNPADDSLILFNTFAIPSLSGNHARINPEQVFLGFDTLRAQTYILNLTTNQLEILPTTFTLEHPPRSVFDTYPMEVLAVLSLDDFNEWRNNPPPIANPPAPYEPFLHWMLPDDKRNITCFADSAWTDENFPVECPGLAQPRTYEGHQGTDIGGLPNGLALGTSIFAARQGLVIRTFEQCPRFDASCGDAYGNHLLMQHTLVRAANIEVWYTGYAHLQTALAVDNTYIEQLGVPIALSGDTGLGGAHLHFELRSLSGWINPYSDTDSLWINGNERPLSAQTAFPADVVQVCQSAAENNIRNGPGTVYDVIGKTTASTPYNVIQSVIVDEANAGGAWYQIQLENSQSTGWLWAELAQNCTDPIVD